MVGSAYTRFVRVILPGYDVDDVCPRCQDEQRLEPAIAHWPLLLRKEVTAHIIFGLNAQICISLLRGGFASPSDENTALVEDLTVLHVVEGEHYLGI